MKSKEFKLDLVYEDKRGKILRFFYKGNEYVLLETKEGYSRGGDYHKTRQFDVVLKGRIEWIETFDGVAESKTVLEEGNMNIVSPNIPHMFTSLEDSLVLEWLEGSFEKSYYEPYRKIIEGKIK